MADEKKPKDEGKEEQKQEQRAVPRDTKQTAAAPDVTQSATKASTQTRQRTSRQQRRQRTMPRGERAARPARDVTPQDRSVTISLPAHQWERLDRLIQRTQRSEGDFFRHLLSPYLR